MRRRETSEASSSNEGANVLLVDLNLPAAERVEKLIHERFPNVKAKATKADVGKEEDVKNAVELAVELFGRLDIMVRGLVFVTKNFHLRDSVVQQRGYGRVPC